MIILIIAGKVFEKIQHPFMIKALNKLDIEVTHINIIKTIYDKHTSHIRFSGERLKALFFTKTRNKARVPTFTSPIQHSTEVVTKQSCKEKKSS